MLGTAIRFMHFWALPQMARQSMTLTAIVSGIEIDYAREPVEILGDCLRIWNTPMT
jgi:hypothetical protein